MAGPPKPSRRRLGAKFPRGMSLMTSLQDGSGPYKARVTTWGLDPGEGPGGETKGGSCLEELDAP